jgi:hypothetical protein
MKPLRIAFALLAILLVVGVIVVVSSQTNLLVTTRTEEFTTTTTALITVTSIVNNTITVSALGNVELAGNCTAVSVFVPDTSAAGVNGTQTYSNTSYSTSLYVNSTASYVIRTTSYDLNDRPSDRYTITVCTYQP